MKIRNTKLNFTKYISLIGLLVLGVWINSCNNDFLDENHVPNQFTSTDTIFISNDMQPFSTSIDLKTSGKRAWRIWQYPSWLNITPKNGVLHNNSVVNFNITVNHNLIDRDFGVYTYPLVFELEDMGLISTTVVYADYGDPTIQINPASISIENTLSGEFEILNRGDGILFWEITEKPDWLSFDITNGNLPQHHHVFVKYTANISEMEPGEYKYDIVLQNNVNSAIKIPVSLIVNAQGYNGVYNDGELIGTEYLSKTDRVIALTKNPNRLLFFNANEDIPKVVELDRIPLCIALSENESKLAVGYSNTELSVYETENGNLLNTHEISAIPINVEFGSEDFIYFIAKVGYSEHLHSLNLNNSEIIQSIHSESGMIPLKKVPNKNILVSSKTGYSPDQLIIFDISNMGTTDSVNTYHMDTYGIWLSDDGERIFTGKRKIYKTPEYIPSNKFFVQEPQVTGEIELEQGLNVDCIAHQSSTERFFVANGFGWVSDKTRIFQFHHTTLVKQKTYEIISEPPGNFPMGNTWRGKAEEMYPSADGSMLWLVQSYPAAYHNDPDIWAIQKVKLDE